MTTDKVPFPISAIVRIWDPEADLADVSFIGYRCDIGWGINTTTGDEYSEGEPLFVVQQSETGTTGQVFLDLYCASLWDMCIIIWGAQSVSDPFIWNNDKQVEQILMDLLSGGPLENDGAGFQQFTGTRGVVVGWNGSAYAEVSAFLYTLLLFFDPTAYINQRNDKLYFGKSQRFNRLTVDVATAGVGDWSFTWQYWNGSGWTSLTNLASTAIAGSTAGLNFKGVGTYIISFDLPANMALVNFRSTDPDDGADTEFRDASLYYIRALQATADTVTVTTAPSIVRIHGALDWAFSLDTTDAAQASTETPIYTSEDQETLKSLIERALWYTKLGLVLKKDGWHAIFLSETLPTALYTYVVPSDGTNHGAYEAQVDTYEVIPNTIAYADEKVTDSIVSDSADAIDSDSVTAHGTIKQVMTDSKVTTRSIANDLAERHMARLQLNEAQGLIRAPMHIGQEIWDTVQVNDSRTGENKKGRVTQIIREWQPGVYSIQLLLGRVEETLFANTIANRFTNLDGGIADEGMFMPGSGGTGLRSSVSIRNKLADARVGFYRGASPLGVPKPGPIAPGLPSGAGGVPSPVPGPGGFGPGVNFGVGAGFGSSSISFTDTIKPVGQLAHPLDQLGQLDAVSKKAAARQQQLRSINAMLESLTPTQRAAIVTASKVAIGTRGLPL